MNASVKLLETVLPASVGLRSVIPESHPSAQLLGTERNGSGVIVGQGLILTVNYVILGAQSVEVSTIDDRSLPARVLAQDFATGLAVVAIKDGGLPGLVPRDSSELQLGQEVFVLAASASNGRRVHDGVISSLGPFDAYWEYALDRAIHTTAMNPGFGGGALIDLHGRLAGIVSLDLNEIGRFTMAIPIDAFLQHGQELLQHGRLVHRTPRAWVGFFCYTLKDHVVIAGVLSGAPAERAGLRSGDVVLTVADKRISNRRDLYTVLWSHRPGDTIALRIFRDNQVRVLTVESADADVFFA